MIAIVLALVMHQQPQTTRSDVVRVAALQQSKECREAGEKFFQREGYADVATPLPDYFTHFNREQSKCLIFISGIAKAEPGQEKAMFMQVFDAVAGTFLGSKILTWNGTDFVTARIRDISGVHQHNPVTPADEAWFNNLMIR